MATRYTFCTTTVDSEWTTINFLKGYEGHKAAKETETTAVDPGAGGSIAGMNVGTAVEANWKGKGKYYKGKIAQIDGEKIYIHYDDGDKEWTTLRRIKGYENYTADTNGGGKKKKKKKKK